MEEKVSGTVRAQTLVRRLWPGSLSAIEGKIDDANTWIEPDGNETPRFRTTGVATQATLVPINQIVHERCDVYWKATPPARQFPRSPS